MLVTAYSPDARSCGASADNITASGYSVWTNGMKMAAADTTLLPFGTMISVPGYDGGNVVQVLDRGGAIKGHRLDMLYPTHEQARVWGAQQLEVTVWEYADGQPQRLQGPLQQRLCCQELIRNHQARSASVTSA
jgi:3D (Asp-Asp-Asp) domain-containing protein